VAFKAQELFSVSEPIALFGYYVVSTLPLIDETRLTISNLENKEKIGLHCNVKGHVIVSLKTQN